MRASLLLTALVVMWCGGSAAAPSPAAPATRIGVVIGNGNYDAAPLANPLNDSRRIAEALGRLDFTVYAAEDLTTPGADAFLAKVETAARNADILFLYYAGHALQHRGDNRLLMVDVQPVSLQAVLDHSLSLSALVERLWRANPRALVVVLDSCRNNPFTDANRNLEAGLSYLETGSGQVMIAYATSAGKVAYDGTGVGSPYSVALSNALGDALGAPKTTLSDIFRSVRRDVREATNGLQIPWVSSSIEDEIVVSPAVPTLVFAAPPPPRPDVPAPSPSAATAADLATLDEVMWHFAQLSGDPTGMTAYVETFPRGIHIADAQLSLSRGAALTRTIVLIGSHATPPPAAEVGFAVTGDRAPPPELRAWPSALPEVPGGLGAIANDCDRAAADPDDPQRLAPGVRGGLIDVYPAARACIAVLVRDPSDARARFQLARVLEAAQLKGWAVAFYKSAIDRGYGAAMVNLGFMTLRGDGVAKDAGEAFALYRQAALAGNLRARTNIGTMFRQGQGVDKSADEALLWYRLAGAMGWPNAIDALAGMYARGEGVAKSPDTAARLYEAAASVGQTNAMNNLGRAYLAGDGVKKSREQGVAWLEKATLAGNRFAPQTLGNLLRDEDPARAVDLLTTSAERGHADARRDLAQMLAGRRGQGDREDALFQARLAQTLGVAKADALAADIAATLAKERIAAVEARVQSWIANNGD